MARRNEHSQAEIKSMVLHAAESIIDEDGVAALTIRKIAMEMGYTVGSIYMVFASRAEIILEINARTLENIATDLQPIAATDTVETWIKAYLQYVPASRWQMIYTPQLLETKSFPDWYQERLDVVFRQFAHYFDKFTAQEKDIYALWQGIHGICLLSSKEQLENAVMALLGIYLRGLSVSE